MLVQIVVAGRKRKGGERSNFSMSEQNQELDFWHVVSSFFLANIVCVTFLQIFLVAPIGSDKVWPFPY